MAFYEMQNSLYMCKDINSLMQEFGFQHKPGDWHLFIEPSSHSESSNVTQWE
jgi:hypothetical protein